MQAEVVVKCMQTNFGGCGLPSFGDLTPFFFVQKLSKFPFGPWTIIYGGQKIESAQKIYASSVLQGAQVLLLN